MRLVTPSAAMTELGLAEHEIRFTATITVEYPGPPTNASDTIYKKVKR